ncbi:MAG TPA: triose-phosphate isomerase [Acidimicrobiales bacterium]|nr:triose-phosphate isomerase [Acidimicrobiales bacterium]
MSERRALVVGNWKMNLDFVEAVHLTQQIGVLLRHEPVTHIDVMVAPPFVDLRSVSSVLESERVPVGLCAQHVNDHESGAHTGEISISMLTRLGVGTILVGHSERRTHYGMNDDVVSATLLAVVRAGQRAILCVGEDLEVRETAEHAAFVTNQLDVALRALSPAQRDLVTVAYEPLWAIGTGRSATDEEVREMAQVVDAVRSRLAMESSRLLYGGSVNADNASELMGQGVDGFLVGGASLKAESFVAILRAVDDCYAELR